jgi:flagellar protein FlhE
MAERRRTGACAALLLAAWIAPSITAAQSYVDRNLSVSPAARDGGRPIVIIAPVQPSTPPQAAPPQQKTGPIGSYASDAPGPDIRARNADYVTQFRVIERIPPGATIRDVAWRYGVASKPKGFEAVLCWQDAGTCWSVTEAGSGNTAFFNGKDASRPFLLYYRVKGSGHLPGGPIKGDMNQVIVTYDVPG